MKRGVLKKFLTQKAVVSVLFAIILISGASGVFPLRMSSRQQVGYAQEDSDFGTFPDDGVPPETDTAAQPTFEICDDLIDDDGDGFVDSDDPEGCTTLGKCDLVREMRAQDCPVEGPPIEICDNFVDDDGDGLVDEDCATAGSQSVFEICDNFVDDDGDGLVDEDCATSVPPQNTNDTTFTIPPQNTNDTTFTIPPQNVNDTTFTIPPDNGTTIPPINECSLNTNEGSGEDALFFSDAEQTPLECTLIPVDPDPFCPSTKPQQPEQTFSHGGFWSFSFGIRNQEGLFLKDIFVKNNHLLDRLSLTHLKVDIPGLTAPVIVRFCDNDNGGDIHDVKPTFTPISEDPGIDSIKWEFVKGVRDLAGNLLGTLTVDYDVIVRFKPVTISCEFGKASCVRLIPKVSYEWKASPDFQNLIPREIQAFYRLDLGKNDPRGRGLVPFAGTGASIGFERFEQQEGVFLAVDRDPTDNSKSIGGKIDNLHDILPDTGVHVPGCRPTFFNCFHMHFVWNKPIPRPIPGDPCPLIPGDPTVDVLVEPSDDSKINRCLAGTPYLVSGQRIEVGIVRFNPTEQAFFSPNPSCTFCALSRPDPDPFSFANGEGIAVGALMNPGDPSQGFSEKKLESGDHILLYYVASSLKQADTFFRHGIYSLDTTKAKLPLTGEKVPNCGEVTAITVLRPCP